MGRRFILVLLALGSAAGFAAGFSSWRWHQQHGWGEHGGPWGQEWRQGRLDKIAEACVRAAERAQNPPGTAPVGAPAPAAP